MISGLLFPAVSLDATSIAVSLDLTNSGIGFIALVIFVVAYLVVMMEEFTHLRKSKPVILATGIIWGIITYVYTGNGDCLTRLR